MPLCSFGLCMINWRFQILRPAIFRAIRINWPPEFALHEACPSQTSQHACIQLNHPSLAHQDIPNPSSSFPLFRYRTS